MAKFIIVSKNKEEDNDGDLVASEKQAKSEEDENAAYIKQSNPVC